MSPTGRAVIALLAASPVFSGVEPATLQRLAQSCGSRTYPKGQVIFHQGDPGDCLYVLVEGLVMVVVGSPAGDRMVVATCRPPEAFGEIALIDDGPRTASVETLTPTRVLTINRADFLALLRTHPAVVESLLRVVGRLFRETLERTSDFIFLDLPGRVAKCLVQLADTRGEPTSAGVSIDLGLTQAAFAAMVGGSRPSVNQILRGLEDRGIVALDGRRILLKHLDHLRRRAGL